MNHAAETDWIAVDWGTSRLRVAAISADGSVLDRRQSDQGMGALQRDDFEPALLALIANWLPGAGSLPVVCSGMVGAIQGWQEAPYRTVPCAPIGKSPGMVVNTVDPRIAVTIVPGIKQNDPADVMRGEETQIAGLLAAQPNFDGVVCLPGTHCKWVHVSVGEIVSFQTFMTGEIFALLAKQSVLRYTVGEDGWDDDSFLNALNDAISAPKMFAARLFSLRAENLTTGLTAAKARAHLSGLLIGMELAASRPYWLGRNLAVIGAGPLANIYKQALIAQGVTPKILDVGLMTIAGLTQAKGALL